MWPWRFTFFACALLLLAPTLALAQLGGSAERIEGFDGSIDNLEWRIHQDSNGVTRLEARAARATLPGLHKTLEKLELQCQSLAVDLDHLACLDGQASMRFGADGPQLGIDDLRVSRQAANGQIMIAGRLWLGPSETRFALEIDADRVSATLEQISASLPLLTQLWAEDLPVALQDGTLSGQGT